MQKVLIVEDNSYLLNFYELIAKTIGSETLKIDVVNGGSEAMSKLAGGERYDRILLDLIMPEVSGVEVLDYIVSLGGYEPEIYIVSNIADKKIRDELQSRGVKKFMVKCETSNSEFEAAIKGEL